MILLEHGPGMQAVRFTAPSQVVTAWRADEVLPALATLDAARARGFWVAGYMGYEAGYALEPRLRPLMPQTEGPLLNFGIYGGPEAVGDALAGVEPAALSAPEPMISRAEYAQAFAQVKAYIAAGDCYQINLTFPMRARLNGTPLGLYAALRARQAVGYGGYLDLGTGPIVISRSPELFFTCDAQGRLEARPMKGTAPRDANPERDAALARELYESEKARAENLMIVDLLRNDIARISQVGSVKVPKLFAVETYATLHQMTSRITGQLLSAPSLAGLMGALFPNGSVTGAPKIRAMEIIREMEPFPRGAYCGGLGWMAPDGDACFNVTIRTLSLSGQDVVMNVGGAVVHDSTESGEWEEALWKARFAQLTV